jgi:hypothetical protein
MCKNLAKEYRYQRHLITKTSVKKAISIGAIGGLVQWVFLAMRAQVLEILHVH